MIKISKVLVFSFFLFNILGLSNIKATESFLDITEKFFNLYKTNPKAAIDYIYSTNVLIKKDSLETYKAQIFHDLNQMGDFISYKWMGNDYYQSSDDIVLVSFIVKFEKKPCRFYFYFYKPIDKWQINNLIYDTLLDEDLLKTFRFREIRKK